MRKKEMCNNSDDCKGIMLSQMSQGETNTVWPCLNVESKQAKLLKTKSRRLVTRGMRDLDKQMLLKGTFEKIQGCIYDKNSHLSGFRGNIYSRQ